jgi:hypothetical protein
MKLRFFLPAILLMPMQSIFAQSIFPAAKSFKVEKGRYISDFKKNIVTDTASIINSITKKAQILFNTMNYNSGEKGVEELGKANKKLIDSLYRDYEDSLKRHELIPVINKLNESSPFAPIVTAGITNLENTKQTYGSLSFGIQFRLTKYKLSKKNWIDPHYLYLMFSAKTATSPDSSSIQKTFMFPELNKRDFVFGYFSEFQKNDWTIAPTFEFSLNKFVDTANKKSFVSQSFNLGCRIQKSFSFNNVNSFVSLYPYYSLITVDKKYATDYQVLIGEPKIPSTFHSIGLHVSAQIPNAILFCNMKYILNKEGHLQSRDLKRYIYTIGTLLSL